MHVFPVNHDKFFTGQLMCSDYQLDWNLNFVIQKVLNRLIQ